MHIIQKTIVISFLNFMIAILQELLEGLVAAILVLTYYVILTLNL